MEPYLLEAYGPVFWPDFPGGPIGGPTGSDEESVERVVGRVHPATSTVKSVGPQCVRAGVQEPRAMASMLSRRIHDQLVDCVHTLVGIVILVRHGGGEAHQSRTVSRDKDAKRSLRGPLNGRAPGVSHLRQCERPEHQLGEIGWPLGGPEPSLQLGNARGLGGPG